VATKPTPNDVERSQAWLAAAFAFIERELNDEEFSDSLPARAYLHPLCVSSEPDLEAPRRNRSDLDDYVDIFISVDDPLIFKVGTSPKDSKSE
jgi:hypothetical protein